MRTDLRYLLHLWQERGDDWHVSLRDVSNGELLTFSDLGEMTTYLDRVAGSGAQETTNQDV